MMCLCSGLVACSLVVGENYQFVHLQFNYMDQVYNHKILFFSYLQNPYFNFFVFYSIYLKFVAVYLLQIAHIATAIAYWLRFLNYLLLYAPPVNSTVGDDLVLPAILQVHFLFSSSANR